MDQDDKALAISARPAQLQYSAYVINECAARCHRKDFLEQIVRQCFEFFDGKPDRQREIQEAADAEAARVESGFIFSRCGEFDLPSLDF